MASVQIRGLFKNDIRRFIMMDSSHIYTKFGNTSNAEPSPRSGITNKNSKLWVQSISAVFDYRQTV